MNSDIYNMAIKLKYHLMPGVYPAFPDVPDLDIFADSLEIRQVGGDYYDFYRIDADHIGIVLADVFDGGDAAALYMVAFKIYLHSNLMMYDSIEDRIEAVNDLLCWDNDDNLCLSAWYGVYEISTGTLKVINAGHEKALVLSQGHVFSYEENVSYLMGVMEGMKYQSFEIKLEPGEKLLLFTDGVVHAMNSKEKEYGRTKLIKAFKDTEGKNAEETIALLQSDLQEHVGTAELNEDATFLCLQRSGGERA
jgi:sigma-B regulation protein RsbU (phosphoserine phosphatase)